MRLWIDDLTRPGVRGITLARGDRAHDARPEIETLLVLSLLSGIELVWELNAERDGRRGGDVEVFGRQGVTAREGQRVMEESIGAGAKDAATGGQSVSKCQLGSARVLR